MTNLKKVGFRSIILVLSILITINIIYAQNISHAAEQIKPGAFGDYHPDGNYIFNSNVGVGKIPSNTLDVAGNTSAVYYFGDGSRLAGINHSKWKPESGYLYQLSPLVLGNKYSSYLLELDGIFGFHDGSAKIIKIDFRDNTSGAELRYDSDNMTLKLGLSKYGNTTPISQISINRYGNVGIGVPNSSERLEVDGNVSADYLIGDGSLLTGINHSKWKRVINETTNISYIYRDQIAIGNASGSRGHLDIGDAFMINQSGIGMHYRNGSFGKIIGFSNDYLGNEFGGLYSNKYGQVGLNSISGLGPGSKFTITRNDNMTSPFSHDFITSYSPEYNYIQFIGPSPYGINGNSRWAIDSIDQSVLIITDKEYTAHTTVDNRPRIMLTPPEAFSPADIVSQVGGLEIMTKTSNSHIIKTAGMEVSYFGEELGNPEISDLGVEPDVLYFDGVRGFYGDAGDYFDRYDSDYNCGQDDVIHLNGPYIRSCPMAPSYCGENNKYLLDFEQHHDFDILYPKEGDMMVWGENPTETLCVYFSGDWSAIAGAGDCP